MLLSVSLILMIGMFMGWICKKVKLPSLLGMLITGILLGPLEELTTGITFSALIAIMFIGSGLQKKGEQ